VDTRPRDSKLAAV